MTAKLYLIQDEDTDPTSTLYRRVRDSIVCNESVTNAEKIGVLEMVKAELIQAMLDEVLEQL